MVKRCCVLLLALCLLLGLLPGLSEAAALEPLEAPVQNSDSQAWTRDWGCYVDTMGDGCLVLERLTPSSVSCTQEAAAPETRRLTDWPVDQLLIHGDSILCSAENRLYRLDPETGEALELVKFDAPLDRFARTEHALYCLSGGRLTRLEDGETRAKGLETPEGIQSFWLEDGDHLCYMTEESTVHSLCLSTGDVTDRPNLASDLGDVPLYSPETEEIQGHTLTSLRQKFPHGKYWNHMPKKGTGPSYNNQNSYTSIPCTKHNNYCGTRYQTCNGFAPNGSTEISWQCMGYAEKCGYDVTGRDPNNWTKYTSSSRLSSLKAGDIVRYKYGKHSIYITAVSGDTVTYTDCNYDGTCVIRWGQTISKSTLRSSFSYIRSAPSAAPVGSPAPAPAPTPTYTLRVTGLLDGTEAADLKDWGSFELWINGKLSKSGCTALESGFPSGTAYELRNIEPAAGVLYEGPSSGSLSGTLTKNTQVVLQLDHYITLQDGSTQTVKYRDLPKPGNWAWKPVCWAIETGVAGGVSETGFVPNDSASRSQMLTFLWRSAGKPAPSEETTCPFTDVKVKSFYYKAMLWALERGITRGVSKTEFDPDGTCTRAAVVTFLWRAAGSPLPEQAEEQEEQEPLPFTDLREGAYYMDAIRWAVENGITKGTAADSFSPDQNCTRAEVLTFLWRARNLLQGA